MGRVFNFSAGPAMLPYSVLKRAAEEMCDYNGCGQSVMEMSHRSAQFRSLIESAEELLRDIMHIPNNYKVLFLQGGATTQFAAVPLNFMNKNGKADYIITGQWSKKAYTEAQKYGDVRIAASSEDKKFSYIPKLSANSLNADADYVHICMNNTVYGTAFHQIPETSGVPLIADISSCFLSEPLEVEKFAMLYGGAQKNIGPAGLTVAVVREDMLGNAREYTPSMLNYKVHADAHSLANTPACYSIYICKLVLEWIKKCGGVEFFGEYNRNKAELFYTYLDNSALFFGTACDSDRSIMNIPFVTGDSKIDNEFIYQAEKIGLVNLKGHRTVGGMRASLYNAMPVDGVKKLVDFMQKFEKSYM